ncbi:MAG: 4'-phosphopantetheinyl transferase superfamily protein [Myxococcales bacterium]|nr:4'-phosphopantetheinyl transferase superfamily protein [Myxococcales bacterium]
MSVVSASQFVPTPGVLDIWELDLARQESEEDLALLTPEELAKGRRIIIPAKCTQSLRARAELRRVLGAYLSLPPQELRFVYGEFDKPDLDPAQQPGPGAAAPVLSFNLSHSEAVGLVGVVLSEGPHALGVDVEHVRDNRDHVGIAESFFAPDEVASFRRLPEHERCDAFYRAWTRKEAYLKALGTGLSFSSTAFSISYGRDEIPRVLRTTRAGDDPGRWQLLDVRCATPGYAAAACWDGAPLPLRRFWGPTSEPSR